MAYGNNILGKQPRAHFQEAGGAIIKFKHPYLVGQISGTDNNIDEIDVSSCCRLADTYLQATPNQDSAVQEVMIDGSTVTITNRLMNGTLSMPVLPGSGLVSQGDFIAALQLIQTVGDSVGGLLTLTEHVNGLAITTIYYGVTPKNVPHKIKMGMSVPSYQCTLVYSGWVQAVSKSSTLNTKGIWATGNKTGVKAAFTPYGINEGDSGEGPVTTKIDGIDTDYADETGLKDGVSFETSTIDTTGTTKYPNINSYAKQERDEDKQEEGAGEGGGSTTTA